MKYLIISSQQNEYMYIISFYKILNSLYMGNELDKYERFVVNRHYFAQWFFLSIFLCFLFLYSVFIKLVNPFICFYRLSPLSPCTINSQCPPLSGPAQRMMP